MACFVYCLLGTSKDVNLGPAAVMSLLTAEFGHSPFDHDDATYAIALSLVCGVFQIVMGILQVGQSVDKLAFHGADADRDILATILVGEDVGVSGDFPVQLATGMTSGNRSRVSDVSARILARMSVSVSVSAVVVVECQLHCPQYIAPPRDGPIQMWKFSAERSNRVWVSRVRIRVMVRVRVRCRNQRYTQLAGIHAR